MKYIQTCLIPLALTLIPAYLNAQKDSVRTRLINVHTIVNGIQTQNYHTRNQKVLTMDNQLIREITFNDSTMTLEHYTFYFYRDGKLLSEENYDKNDSLLYILKHTYNAAGKVSETGRLTRDGGRAVQTSRTEFIYDQDGNLITKKDFRIEKKPCCITTFAYSSGNLIKEQSKARKSPDGVRNRTADFLYADDGKLKKKIILEKSSDKTIKVLTESYFYTSEGYLEKVEIHDSGGKLTMVKNYTYHQDGTMYHYFEKNGEGNLQCYYTYDYREHFINLGTQKSYFDKP